MIKNLMLVLLLTLGFNSCADESGTPDPGIIQPTTSSDWLIPENQVLDGGVGKDGIPSIDNPEFTTAATVEFLNDEDLILGIKAGDVIKAYPHPILDWHEIVNDDVGDQAIALTYCPLTGTGVGWDRIINGEKTTFGVSGLLYNTNLMPYDRETNSTWSQQRLDCVNGENKGKKAIVHSFIETKWATWKASFPQSQVLNTNTGFSRNYNRYPYGDYRTNDRNIIFPISNEDDRLAAKERVLGVRIDDTWRAYTFGEDNIEIELISDKVEGQRLFVIRSGVHNFIVAFKDPDDGRKFSILPETSFPEIFQDDTGTKYNLLGESQVGTGKQLELVEQFMGYWFSWGTFYPDIEIF